MPVTPPGGATFLEAGFWTARRSNAGADLPSRLQAGVPRQLPSRRQYGSAAGLRETLAPNLATCLATVLAVLRRVLVDRSPGSSPAGFSRREPGRLSRAASTGRLSH